MKRFLTDLKRYYKYAFRLSKAELTEEVSESYLNWLWWIIHPLMMMLIYVFVFTVVFKSKETYYTVFIFLGLAGWDFFNRMLNESVNIIRNNRNIILRIYIPKYILLLSKSFTFLFKFFISMLITIVLMFIFKIEFSLTCFYMILLLPILYMITFGIGCILIHLGVYIDDLKKIVEIVLRLLFYLSGVFYSISERLHGLFSYILLNCNPIAFFMDEFRKCMLYNQHPNFLILSIWFVIGIIIFTIGIHTIYKYENSYAKVI